MGVTALPAWLQELLAPYGGLPGRGGLLVDEIARELAGSPVDQLRRLALLVLRPDCLAQGTAPAVVAHLVGSQGMVPLRLRVLNLRPDQFDRLYQLKLPLFARDVWLHHRLAELGPSAVVVLGGDPEGFPSLCQRLSAVKGASAVAEDGNPGALRPRFGRSSSFHALVHASEDPGAFLVEAAIFFGWTELRELLGWGARPGMEPACVAALLDGEPWPGRTVYEAVLAVKRKVLASLLLAPVGPGGEALGALWQLAGDARQQLGGARLVDQRDLFMAFVRSERELLAAAIAVVEAETPPRVQQALVREAGSGVAGAWPALAAALAPLRLLYASWFLAGHDAYTEDDGRALFRLLAEHNVPLTAWQEVMLQAALRGDTNPDARWQGRPLYAAFLP